MSNMHRYISNSGCPNCKDKSPIEYIRVKNWSISKCLKCELLWTTNPGNPMESRKFYDDRYIHGYKRREIELKRRFREYLNLIENHKQGGRILDLGCGMGYFMYVATNFGKYRWSVSGLEPDISLIKNADDSIKKKIVVGKISKIPFRQNSFDCVTCFDVFEHDVNLNENLSEIKRVLKKDGIFVIQAPNYKSLMAYIAGSQWDWWAVPDHVLHFSFTFVINYLEQKGFKVLKKFTYERTKDFLSNIKSRFGKDMFMKILFYCFIPMLLLLERGAWKSNLGALSFVIAKSDK